MNRSARQRTFTRARHGQAGFTLLEALISFMVLAIGLLGLAGLQIQGMRYNQEAYARSQATFLAYDMLERVRLNRANALDYVGDDPGGVCDAANNGTALNDRICWHDAIGNTIAGANGTIAFNPATNLVTITVRWLDRNSNDNLDPVYGTNKQQRWQTLVMPAL